MFADLSFADVATTAVAAVGVSALFFAGWNCFIDMRRGKRRSRSDDDNQRLADECAGMIVAVYGPRQDERRRSGLRRRVAEIVYRTLSASGDAVVAGKLAARRLGTGGPAMVAQRKPVSPPSSR